MKKSAIIISIIVPLLFFTAASFFVQTEKLEAMPGFARMYNMSCTTCHAPAPRLKAYGDEFAGNGFVLKDQEAPRYFTKTGDDKLNLIRTVPPIGLRIEGYYKHQTETDKDVDLSFPYNIKLISGGPIAKNMAYYFYFFFSEHGEIAGLEDAFIMFNNLGGRDLDLYLGQFAISDPMFKGELRLTYDKYQIYGHSVGESQIDLKYDRGLMVTYGIEKTGTGLTMELVNGNGIGETGTDNVYDDDKYKCGLLHASQDVNEYFRIGGFGYYGKEGEEFVNEVVMGGIDATFAVEKAELNVQFVERKDGNPGFADNGGSATRVKSRGGLAELIFMPDGERSQWYGVGLYNVIDYDGSDDIALHTLTGHIGYLLNTNIRVFVEDTYDLENEENRFVLGLMTAF